MTTVLNTHILLDEQGVAWLGETNVKVVEVVVDMLSGMAPDDIHREFPDLSLAQIHAALAWYYDHKPEFDAKIAEDQAMVAELRAGASDSPARQKLRSLGHLP